MLCYAATADDYDAMTYTACELFVKASVPAQGLAYLKVESVDPKDADAASYSAPTDTDADWIKSA